MLTKLMQLTRRNLIIFFKDKKRIFFTFISPIIVLACFVLFARRIYMEQMPPETLEIVKKQYADILMLIGLLSVTSFTNAVSLSSIMVADAERKVLNDLYISPIHGGIVRFSYLIYNIILNITISMIMFIIGISWIAIDNTMVIEIKNQLGEVIKTYHTFDAGKIFTIIALIILGAFLNGSIFVFCLSFLKNTSAFSAISASLSAIAGFLIGAFVPLQTFPRAVAEFSSIIPSTHISNMVRYFILKDLIFTEPSVQTGKAAVNFNILFGQDLKWWGSLIYTFAWTGLMMSLNIMISNLKRK